VSVTSITDARSIGTATTACGFATASAAASAASDSSAGPIQRRQAGNGERTPARTIAAGKRTA
jgi:hypothetical protein